MLLDLDGTQYFPPGLLFYPSCCEDWTWLKFELLHGHFHAIKMLSLKDMLQCQLQQAKQELHDVTTMHTIALKTFNKKKNYRNFHRRKKDAKRNAKA